MKNHIIEVDDIIMDYLKKNAEPFSDTPNSVLHRMLFRDKKIVEVSNFQSNRSNNRLPMALTQTLDVIHEVINNGLSRQDATRLVAERNGTTNQTIIDKYCRQLGKTASEIDRLLQESGLNSFQTILKIKFPKHKDTIDSFFNNLRYMKFESHSVTMKIGDTNDNALSGDGKMLSLKEIGLINLGKDTNPVRFRFDGEEFVVNSWTDLCLDLIKNMLEKGYLKPSHLPIHSYSSRMEKYFINDKPKHKYPEKDAAWKQIGLKPVYVDVKYSADAHFKNISHLFKHLQLGDIDFGIAFK